LLELAEHDPAAFRDPALKVVVRDFATAVTLADAGDADRVFDALGHRLGGDGLDILYEIVRVRGGSKAASRAELTLREAGAMDRASTALKITWALREPPCTDKAALLERAVAEGDARTLAVLETSVTACLGPANSSLRTAITALRMRLR
jgi:serine/threonine-protein kinase